MVRNIAPKNVPLVLWFPGGPQLYTSELYKLMIEPNKILGDLKWRIKDEPPRRDA